MPNEVIKDLKRRMEGAIVSFHGELKGLRTGRASAALLDHITVEVYGSRMHLNQVSTVNAPESRLIVVQVWDSSNTSIVEKAILNSGLGLNPVSEGTVIRVPIPDLSEERRKDLVKVAGQYAEQARISVRNIRRDGMDSLKKLEKDGGISEDEIHSRGDEIQKLTDDFIKQIEEALAKKSKDIMAV